MEIESIAGKYILDPGPPRTGGTSHVHRARIHGTDDVVAVKLYDGVAIENDELRRELFEREREGLTGFHHPHVVTLLDAGRDEKSGKYYLAMEWLETDFVSHLQSLEGSARKWSEFATRFLRPILEGLSAAHARRLIHRDIKPANLMVDSGGAVKMTDFGTSKLLDSTRVGMTVNEFRSRPYSPPEQEIDGPGMRGDLYSLGVTAIDLLGDLDSRLAKDADPRDALKALSIDEDARNFLADLVDPDPRQRPFSAKVALTDLNRLLVWANQPSPRSPKPSIRVALTDSAITRGAQIFGVRGNTKSKRLIESDLGSDEVPIALGVDDRREVDWTNEGAIRLNLIGAELLYGAAFSHDGSGTIVVTAAIDVPSSLLERRREQALGLDFTPQFSGNIADQRDRADRLIEALREHSSARATKNRGRAESELFGRWRSLLMAKSELEAKREDPLQYRSWSRDDRLLTFDIGDEDGGRFVEQMRCVSLPEGGVVLGEVIDGGPGALSLAVERGDIGALPDRGQLLVERGPSRRAIARQKQALDALHNGTAARTDLPMLLAAPDDAPPVETVPGDEGGGPSSQALAAAIASPDFTLVHGPPGTGKTTFIVELIRRLAADPEARVLLSAQTHVAVDNALAMLGAQGDLRIVRVGRTERIDPEIVPLTTDPQLVAWREAAAKRAKDWLEDWGRARGISPEALAAHGAVTELRVYERQAGQEKQQIADLEQDAVRLLAVSNDPKQATGAATSSGELISDLEDELVAVEDELEARRADLDQATENAEKRVETACELLGLEAPCTASELDSRLAQRFDANADDLDEYRALVALQDEWLTRFGQSQDFADALISRAQVVAGTCVGLAASLGEAGHFDLTIVDEVSKATPTEALVPMIAGKRWVLVGDDRQLPPFVDSDLIDQGLLEAHGLSRADLAETLFTQLAPALPADRRRSLSIQHRMLKPIGSLISKCFYDGLLDSSRGSLSNRKSLHESFPAPVTWYSTNHLENRFEESFGTTFWNEREIEEIRRILNRVQAGASRCDERLQVAVITGYGEQARRLRRALRPNGPQWENLDLHIHPVDSFQGQERDLVIYSVTRCNAKGKLGFLKSEQRINVALSRARDALVIVGDHAFCEKADEGENPFAEVLHQIEAIDGCHLEVLS